MKDDVCKRAFIIGAPKTGTTALARHLALHNKVILSNPKEPNFFCPDIVNWNIKYDLQEYNNRCYGQDIADDFCLIDASTNYLYSSLAVPSILDAYPNAKFIVGLREPSQLCLSLHSELLKSGRQDIISFKDAWARGADEQLRYKIPLNCDAPKLLDYKEIASLGKHINRLLSVVNPSSVFIYEHSELEANFEAIYRQILEFLGLTQQTLDTVHKVNSATYPKSVFASQLIALARNGLRSVGFKGFFGVGNYLRKMNSITGKAPYDLETENEIKQLLRNDIKLLESTTRLNLEHWYVNTN